MNFILTKSKPLAKTVLALGILFLIVTIVTVFNISKDRNSSVYKPSPIPQAQPIKLDQPIGFANELSKLRSSLPHSENGFTIDYQSEVNILSVKITAASKDQYRNLKGKAESFIKAKGVGDICSLNIFWVPQIEDSTIRKSLETQDLYASGCQPPPVKDSP